MLVGRHVRKRLSKTVKLGDILAKNATLMARKPVAEAHLQAHLVDVIGDIAARHVKRLELVSGILTLYLDERAWVEALYERLNRLTSQFQVFCPNVVQLKLVGPPTRHRAQT